MAALDQRNLVDDIGNVLKHMCLSDPFYALFLSSIGKEENTQIPFAAISVDINALEYTLLINPEPWFKMNRNEKMAMLKHECLHLTNFHLINCKDFSNQKMDNIGCDISINQMIDRTHLPKDGCFLDDFKKKYPKLDWAPLKGRKHYYDQLQSLPEEEKEKMGLSEGSKHIWILEGGGEGQSKNPNSLSQGQQDLLRSQMESQIENLAEEVSKTIGHLPQEISDLIKGFKKPKPHFDYKKYIRVFVGNSTKYLLKHTRSKENPRYEGQPKIVMRPKNKVAIYTDESGSMSEAELRDCLNEVYHLSKKDYELDIMPFDTTVLKTVIFDPTKDIWNRSKCGGTDPTCCIEHYNKHKEYNSAIIFTDGYFGEVLLKTFKPLLWVITSNGTTEAVKNQKEVIKIPKHGKDS